MNILSIHCSHHASVSIASDNKLVAHSELSRFNKQKYTPWPDINVIKKIQSLNLEYDVVLFSKLPDNCFPMYDQKLLKQMGVKDNAQIHISDEHHLFHAACGRSFKNNFDNYFVWDGNGALINVDGHQGTETYSLWNSKLDLQKRILTTTNCVDFDDGKNYLSFKNIGIGEAYMGLCRELRLFEKDLFSEGKAMALSSHGVFDEELHNRIFYKNGFNRNYMNVYNISKEIGDRAKYTTFKIYDTHKNNHEAQNYAHTFQKGVEKLGLEIVESFKTKGSILFSGGVAQNVLLNTYLSKHIEDRVEFDPICNDQGISLGHLNYYLSGELERESICYLGFKPYYDLSIFRDKFEIEDCDQTEPAIKLIDDPIAIFQGRSEQGQRGLGHRSLLMNPLHKECIKKVNKVKKREWYRPFACSILHEQLEEYFVVDNNRSPEFMTHVFNARFFKKKELKNVIAEDGTCRLQSVTRYRNYRLHELLRYFYDIKKCPFLLNTSLNLPGQPIVEDLQDLKDMMLNSDLKYAWLPDVQKFITKKI